ncbi:MAG: hypothetical protein HS101_09765 [Planctomycetia bacterium]|nr:hypothetical protein [Planctomycetia bacterium]MCC7315294.1 hypothetical protein [Planctomycetota bacterium]
MTTHHSTIRTRRNRFLSVTGAMAVFALAVTGCGTQADNMTPGPGAPVVQPGLSASANSITAVAAGTRNDPEGIAAPASVNNVTWKDSLGANRSMIIGPYLYQYDFSFNDGVQTVTRSANDDAYGHEGFGYVVSHNNVNGNSPIGKANAPTSVTTTVFSGGHHAIHRVEMLYDRDKEGGGNGIKIPVVIDWFVATGRDHPVWAVTWKTGQATNPGNTSFDVYRMDVRGPYGSLNWDGAASRNAGDAIGGVSWGDAGFKFRTTDAMLTLNSPWIYSEANTVNFTRSWTANTNAEMGIVETMPLDKQMGYGDRVVGRERGTNSAAAFPNKGDCNGFGDARVYAMPCVTGWPYQLMNYDWDPTTGKPAGEATGTKLIAWGSPYGWLGASSFSLFDYSGTADGRGDRSYATLIVLGPKNRFDAGAGMYTADGDVAIAIKQVEAMAAATITNVTAGALVMTAPRGPGAAQTKTLVNGYDPSYTTYNLTAAANQAAFTMTPAAGKPVKAPIFVIREYAAGTLPSIMVDGAAVTVNTGAADAGAFVSLNTATQELWVTLNRTVSAATTVSVAP